MFNNILVVCVGNICRSPTAEYFFRKRFKELNSDIAVSSAGLVGKPAAEKARELAAEKGVDLSPHIARQITKEMIHSHDLILVMEQGHIQALESITPAARGKANLLGRWHSCIEIPDPYRQGDAAYEHALNLIRITVEEWTARITS